MSEAILKETKKVVIVNAGHWSKDSGASYGDMIEAEECKKIRNELVPMLMGRGYEVHAVPDLLDLKKSIAWANVKAPNLNDALAIDIHLNFMSNTSIRGTESFHGVSDTSKEIAESLSNHVSRQLGIPNRHAKPDTASHVGSLGWIRKTTMWATLIEVCFLTNKEDAAALQKPGGYRTAAKGISNAVDEIFGMESPEIPAEKTIADYTLLELIDEIKRKVSLFI